jgi:hypothetical protein
VGGPFALTMSKQTFEKWEFKDLDEIENALHDTYVANSHSGNYLVRFLGTQGEPGFRCLMLNLELRDDYFQAIRGTLDDFARHVRQTGFAVDELLQMGIDESRFNTRVWILIYETDFHENSQAG